MMTDHDDAHVAHVLIHVNHVLELSTIPVNEHPDYSRFVIGLLATAPT